MQRKLKLLRQVVLGLLVAFIALIAVLYNSRSGRRPTEAIPINSARRANDRAQLVADVFEDTQTIGGRVVSKIRARRTTQFKSGWYLLEDVHLTIFRPDQK